MRRTGTWAFSLAAVVLAPAAVLAQIPPGGPEIPVNQVTAGDQVSPAVAVEADGGYVVAWVSGASTIAARRFDRAGAPRGPEFPVSVVPIGANARPAVAAHPGGGFVVAWHAADASFNGIFARHFDASGTPTAGPVAVNLATAGDELHPRIAGGPLGYAVAWQGGSTVVARLLNAVGTPLGVEIQVGTGILPAVAWRGNGLAFAWTDSGDDVYVRLFDGAGAPVGLTSVANGANPPMTVCPVCFAWYTRRGIGVAAAPNGSFAVTWDLAAGGIVPGLGGGGNFYGEQFGSYIRRFNAAGGPLGPEARLNAYTEGSQKAPSLSIVPGGGPFVAWSSVPDPEGCSCGPTPSAPQDGSGASVYARLFDASGNDIGGGEFRVNATTAGDQSVPAVAATDFALFAVYQMSDGAGVGLVARRFGELVSPVGFEVDPTDEPFSDGNRVLESWEAAMAAPAWRNGTGAAQALTSTATSFTGPAGPTYSIVDGAADFGVIPDGASRSCRDIGDCFLLGVSGARPAAHWDAQLIETAPPPSLFAPRTRAVHVGDSFFDVPRGGPYRFVETVFHTGVMAPCAPGYFCPSWAVTRETMAQFVLKAQNPSFVPPACVAGAERFVDVPASSPYCPWVEELARRGVVAGCGGGRYCPLLGVSRETMAVYLLLTREGTGYTPPACTAPLFNDVPASSPFCRWIEELARRGIVAGCGGGAYCPFLGVARDQMSVFLTGTFALLLYAP